jgi:hypothetical protein
VPQSIAQLMQDMVELLVAVLNMMSLELLELKFV